MYDALGSRCHLLTCAPDPAQEGVDDEDARPPPCPEGIQHKAVGPVLRQHVTSHHHRRKHVRHKAAGAAEQRAA
jgi:hypothetical protein